MTIGKDTNPKDRVALSKIPLSLLSPIAKAAWALAQFAGLTKYGAWSWRAAGVRLSVYLDAIDRHRDAFLSGETHDPVDGTHHLGNIMACCAIILDATAAGKLIDDRPPSVSLRPAYAEGEALMPKLRKQYEDCNPRHYTIADTEPAGAAPAPEPTVDGCKVGDRVEAYNEKDGYVYLAGALRTIAPASNVRFEVENKWGDLIPYIDAATRLRKVGAK